MRMNIITSLPFMPKKSTPSVQQEVIMNHRMSIRMAVLWLAVMMFFSGTKAVFASEKRLKVVTTLSNYAFVAQFIGGDNVDVTYIGDGDVDPHFVKPKPSYAVLIKNADLFISTGLDLELWEPPLLARAGNPRVMPGNPGYLGVAAGITLLEKPATASREMGDIHIYGNPHVYVSPWLMKRVAENIHTGLVQLDPAHKGTYDRNLERFKYEIDRRLFGETLVKMFGGELLDRLVASGKIFSFLENRSYKGRRLIDYLGGWFKTAQVFRGKKIVCYHKNWIYFTTLFGLKILDYVEPKPGIPPSPRHVSELIERMKRENVHVLLAAKYFDRNKVMTVAERSGAIPVIVPMGVDKKYRTYFDVVDLWVNSLAEAYQQAAETSSPAS